MTSEQGQNSLRKDDTFYDNTRLVSYKKCPREYFLKHWLGWDSEGIKAPLVFGLGWHDAQDVIWSYYHKVPSIELMQLAQAAFQTRWVEEGYPEEMDIEQLNRLGARTPMVAAEMLYNYVDVRKHVLENAEIVAVEAPFAVPLPGGGRRWLVGRLDKVINYNAQQLVIEHKSTTEYKIDGGFRETYIQSWSMDSQTKGYQYGGNLYYGTVDGVWVDAALVHKKVHDKFKFIPVSHQLPILDEWMADTLNWISRIERDTELYEQSHEAQAFPKNEFSCYGKFGACTFVDICRTTPDPTKLPGPPNGFIHKPWEPFNILKLQKLIDGGQDA